MLPSKDFQSRGFPIYIVQYRQTDSGSSPSNTISVSETYVIIENLSPSNGYSVSVAAAVRDGQDSLMGPFSENIEVSAISSSSKLRIKQ